MREAVEDGMVPRFIREEDGMTMGLAVIIIVLIGVMGAGLLTFVRNDLNAVVEVNQGQRGFEWAESGVEAARMQLNTDADGERYNGNNPLDDLDVDADTANSPDSEWSYINGGKTLNLDGSSNRVKVSIQYLKRATTATQTRNPDYAPEVLPTGKARYPGNREYFKVVAQGTAMDANRRVEAIYYTRDTGFPYAYFATGDIDFRGNAFNVGNVSVFSQSDVLNVRDNIMGCDTIYENWNRPPWNNKSRTAGTRACTASDGTPFTGVPTGIGAEGDITYKQGAGSRLGNIDYSEDTTPQFVPNTWAASGGAQGSDKISYPFNPDPNTHVDLDILRAVAAAGLNGSKLVSRPAGSAFDIDDYPTNSGAGTVYYVEFVGPDGSTTNATGSAVAKGQVRYTSSPSRGTINGTVVVVNGDLSQSPSSKTDFRGVILMRDPVDDDGIKMEYENRGNFDLEGFVNVEGTISIRGSADSIVPDSVLRAKRPGTYAMERWSWRECFNEACN